MPNGVAKHQVLAQLWSSHFRRDTGNSEWVEGQASLHTTGCLTGYVCPATVGCKTGGMNWVCAEIQLCLYSPLQESMIRAVQMSWVPVKHLLTYSMVQSPSWEANWFAASQEIPRISRNPKVHYRTLKHSHWASPIQSIYPHPTSWRSILILSTHLSLGLPCRLLPSGFPTKSLYTPLSSPTRATCPAHLIF